MTQQGPLTNFCNIVMLLQDRTPLGQLSFQSVSEHSMLA